MDILNIDPKVLILQTGAFIILLIVFKLFLFKPVLGIIAARQAEIDNDYQKAKSDKESAMEMKVQYEKQLAVIKDTANEKMNVALQEADAAKNEIIETSRKQAQDMITKAKTEISEEKDAAMRDLQGEVTSIALEAASKIIQSNMDSEKNRKLVASVISNLDGKIK